MNLSKSKENESGKSLRSKMAFERYQIDLVELSESSIWMENLNVY